MKHLELFAGIGGFRMAMDILQRDGIMSFEHVGFSEIEPKAIQTYKANYETKGEIELGDIVSFTNDPKLITDLPDIDIITGGFPCQSFSMMGKQLGFKDDRGLMFFRIMDIVRVKRPKYLLLENVKNLYTHDKGKTFRNIKEELEVEGYTVFSDIFNTEFFGLPQTRNRVIIFATLNPIQEKFSFNREAIVAEYEKIKEKAGISIFQNVLDVLEKDVDAKYFLSERLKPTILADGSAGFKSKSEINKLIARPLTATMHKMHRACQDNYYSQGFIDTHGEDNPNAYLSKEDLAKIPIRKLTPKEALMLQGFPSTFVENAKKMHVSDGALYKQAGNAVSVNVIYAILYYLFIHNQLK